MINSENKAEEGRASTKKPILAMTMNKRSMVRTDYFKNKGIFVGVNMHYHIYHIVNQTLRVWNTIFMVFEDRTSECIL